MSMFRHKLRNNMGGGFSTAAAIIAMIWAVSITVTLAFWGAILLLAATMIAYMYGGQESVHGLFQTLMFWK